MTANDPNKTNVNMSNVAVAATGRFQAQLKKLDGVIKGKVEELSKSEKDVDKALLDAHKAVVDQQSGAAPDGQNQMVDHVDNLLHNTIKAAEKESGPQMSKVDEQIHDEFTVPLNEKMEQAQALGITAIDGEPIKNFEVHARSEGELVRAARNLQENGIPELEISNKLGAALDPDHTTRFAGPIIYASHVLKEDGKAAVPFVPTPQGAEAEEEISAVMDTAPSAEPEAIATSTSTGLCTDKLTHRSARYSVAPTALSANNNANLTKRGGFGYRAKPTGAQILSPAI